MRMIRCIINRIPTTRAVCRKQHPLGTRISISELYFTRSQERDPSQPERERERVNVNLVAYPILYTQYETMNIYLSSFTHDFLSPLTNKETQKINDELSGERKDIDLKN